MKILSSSHWIKMGLLFSTLLFCCASPSWSEQVSPSPRVKTYLRVHQQPDAESEVIGRMAPTAKAVLLETVPWWYRVQLEDGSVGYVSKAWSQKSEAETGRQIIRVGSWNIKKLGHGSNKDYPAVARIIAQNFDVLAIIEVMQKAGGHPGYDTLITELGQHWSGIVTESPRPRTSSGSAEFYAILYRTETVRTCSGWDTLVFIEDNDGTGNDTRPDYFSREPAFGCFEAPTKAGTTGFDFLLSAYHARWSRGNTTQIKEEVGHLKTLFQFMETARPGEKDLLLTGDFNLSPTQIEALLGVQVTTQGVGSTLNKDGERTSNLYDNLLVHDHTATSELIGEPHILDVIGLTEGGDNFYRTISDHLPLQATFRITGPDDD